MADLNQIIYSCVARDTTILAESSLRVGNFTAVVESIFEMLQPGNDKRSLVYDAYMFHYIIADGLCYLCCTDQQAARRVPFAFLADIQKRFVAEYGSRSFTAGHLQFNSDFGRTLSAQMDHYSTDDEIADASVSRVQMQVDEVRNIMVDNISKLVTRQDKLDLMVEQAEELKRDAARFKQGSSTLKRSIWRKNMKLTLIVAAIVAVMVLVLTWLVCGFPDFGTCRSAVSSVLGIFSSSSNP